MNLTNNNFYTFLSDKVLEGLGIAMESNLHWSDWLVVALYFVAVLAFGLWVIHVIFRSTIIHKKGKVVEFGLLMLIKRLDQVSK